MISDPQIPCRYILPVLRFEEPIRYLCAQLEIIIRRNILHLMNQVDTITALLALFPVSESLQHAMSEFELSSKDEKAVRIVHRAEHVE